jgi:hypothetical protein
MIQDIYNNNFCAFILTHGRPDKVITYKNLRRCGYTGKIFIVVDNEDKCVSQYIETFGEENVLIFDKLAISKTFDEYDTFDDRRSIVYARNVCFKLAKKLGYNYFIQLDDDYTIFRYRWMQGEALKSLIIHNLDEVFYSYLKYYINTPQILTIALSQGGDFICGASTFKVWQKRTKRKAMNSFICSTYRPFNFLGRINEDVNTYTLLGSRGGLFLTFPDAMLDQRTTQSNSGGMSDIYNLMGTYVKSFYTVLAMPSSVHVGALPSTQSRLHHLIKWPNTVPCIISEDYKK